MQPERLKGGGLSENSTRSGSTKNGNNPRKTTKKTKEKKECQGGLA